MQPSKTARSLFVAVAGALLFALALGVLSYRYGDPAWPDIGSLADALERDARVVAMDASGRLVAVRLSGKDHERSDVLIFREGRLSAALRSPGGSALFVRLSPDGGQLVMQDASGLTTRTDVLTAELFHRVVYPVSRFTLVAKERVSRLLQD